MAEPFLCEIRQFSFNFAPKGWAACNGQTMTISQNPAVFSLVGTFYGGNGIQTFALPNLEGRAIVGAGQSYAIGESFGQASHALTASELPSHNHGILASTSSGTATTPLNNVYAVPAVPPRAANLYSTSTTTNMSSGVAIEVAGGSQAHPNEQPYLVTNYCIALIGIFPSRS